MPNTEKATEARVADYRSPSVSSSESDSEIQIEPIQSRRQHYPEVIGSGDGLLTPQISRLSHNSLARKTTSIGTTGTNDPGFEVDWKDENDPENPWNWPLSYTAMCITFLSWNTLVIVLFSTSYTSGSDQIAREFNVSETIVTLGLTFYLIGLAAGSVVMAPLSEIYGRRPVSIASLIVFNIMIIPCAVAKSVVVLIIFRFIGAFAGSVMISSAPGMVADLVPHKNRALAFSVWSLGPINGPVLGPIIGGFVSQYLGWRWSCWISLMLGVVALAFSCVMKETYAPVLLRNKAAKLRKETGDSRWWSRYDHKVALKETMKTNLARPFVMAVLEPICIFWNLYVGVVYGILYLCFTSYPIVFRDIRGWGLGVSGLAFLGIGLGTIVTITSEPLIRRIIQSHKKDPETGEVYPEAMVSAVCIGSILIPAGELWFAWTCAPASIPWPAPIAAGIFFGAGNTAVFIYASNYLTHSYGIYAASALAGNSVIRSVLGGVMPLVGTYMYSSLGPNWSGTLLGLLEVACIPIPFIFWKYGHKIRQKSTFIRMMQEDQRRLNGKRKVKPVKEEQQPSSPPETFSKPGIASDDPEKGRM
ncbi:putative MFS multidrug transporter [Talaromyces proteolyticus]|uniref:MFS multidrug transporter n=1 Tax=Talaromyces proteolyticus TaxID=1131652 RepID=A0AAD4KU18_9EURO|nr:putative MFS multidrug transporter [Talaromyces proteolyticus]KAH8697090.1 putative MFS multidrug transporter [Talaromyces proteolyticus]